MEGRHRKRIVGDVLRYKFVDNISLVFDALCCTGLRS